jgi:hypothetical protein
MFTCTAVPKLVVIRPQLESCDKHECFFRLDLYSLCYDISGWSSQVDYDAPGMQLEWDKTKFIHNFGGEILWDD